MFESGNRTNEVGKLFEILYVRIFFENVSIPYIRMGIE